MIFLLVVFDLEGTLVNAELFPEVGRRLGNGDLLTEITNLAMNGDLKFEEAFFQFFSIVKKEPVRETARTLYLMKKTEV